ncbi:mechanosensitive ion channel family protein [Schumannella luteola]|uniref:Small-conductance mechanosensitive channel/CRP-like cAMP-binding protein n=1 Tax=Schumannella luteola TaxID=472059 RepID=A0A852YBJ1_9MICO|nr:small-conductance mechanosensitive channel/CRP-like cAMP-binding protein [Schumannella luteola]
MVDLIGQPWFWPSLAVVVGLPILLLVLTELHSVIARRHPQAAKVVRLVRNFLVPLAALLILISQVQLGEKDLTWTRVAATFFGFALLLVVLNGVNVALFTRARPESWRARMPSIFIDIFRLVLILVGLGVLFAWVWGADVGGLFTALGVSTVVIGLALQNAVGPVVSGLFLLFEQPFRLGDWLDTGGVRGRVVEVNWRAVHIDTGNGIHIVPNGTLAGASFDNLSKAPGAFVVSITLPFSTDDPPHEVLDLLRRVADDLPVLAADHRPSAYPLGGAKYGVDIPVASPAIEAEATAQFHTVLWYAARRANLHLDNDLTDDYNTPERRLALFKSVASSLRLTQDEAEAFADRVLLQRFGAGEKLQHAGDPSPALRVIAVGTVALTSPVDGGGDIPLGRLTRGEMIGIGALTNEINPSDATAVDDVTVLSLPIAELEQLVRRRPQLARDLGTIFDQRKASARVAIDDSAARQGRALTQLGDVTR